MQVVEHFPHRPRGAWICGDGFRGCRSFLALPPANFRHAAGVQRCGTASLNGCEMTLPPTKGEFTGSLLLPANGRRVTSRGVLLEKSGEGFGALLSPDAEMAVTLGPERIPKPRWPPLTPVRWLRILRA